MVTKMYDKTDQDNFMPKTFTGIQDIFGSTPFHNVLYRNLKHNNEDSVHNTNGDANRKSSRGETLQINNEASYITSENFHGLNRGLSRNSIIRSTSTIFYDLDEIAKRHSFHGLPEASASNANILKVMKLPTRCGFKGNVNSIVQECTTIQPVVKAKDSKEMNTKRVKPYFPHNDILSSEIFLRDKRLNKRVRKNLYYNTDVINHQKFWSYAKYQTEYTKPVSDKKSKKKDVKGKRTDDPCPCQLFSYACPCTDEKSLTELAKNSKCTPAVDRIISATICTQEVKKKPLKTDSPRENKSTGVTKAELETIIQEAPKIDSPSNTEANSQEVNKTIKCKKIHKIICPNCKENVEAISFTEDENGKVASLYASKELASTAAYNCSTSSRSNKNKSGDGDICIHDPRCELIPVCQILPTDETYDSLRGAKKRTSSRSVPKVIRITKACRHHPPCTVVPSCQRANVLRNNCEFVPPCLHRPRCVNLPLCVPHPKNINYDEVIGKYVNEEETTECHHIPRCKLVTMCQESLGKNAEHHYNFETNVSSQCNKENIYNVPSTYIISPKNTFSPCSRSPDRLSSHSPDPPCSISNKSCQFNCYQFKLESESIQQEAPDANGVVYIRDVGCQFHNIQYSPMESLVQYKSSSATFENLDIKAERYCRTLRYEDKWTNVVLEQDPISTDSVLSGEIDLNCPSHGRGYYMKVPQVSGFRPAAAYVTAFAEIPRMTSVATDVRDMKSNAAKLRETYPIKSRRSFFKGKCRKFFSVRKSNMSTTLIHCISKKISAD